MNYKVLHCQVGPFPKEIDGRPFVFSRADFERLHPAPKDQDSKEYWDTAIERLIDLKAIAPTEDKANEVPLGPENPMNKPEAQKQLTPAEVAAQVDKAKTPRRGRPPAEKKEESKEAESPA